jgi:integrase
LHDVRHTHATLLLARGTPVKVVQERLGHASPVITLTIHAHVMPGMQAAAAKLYGQLMSRS